MPFCTSCGKPVEDTKFCPNCGAPVGQAGPPPPGYAPGPGAYPGTPSKRRFPVWGIALIIVAVLLVVAGVIVAIAVPVFLAANTDAQRRTCVSNLRTIDGAIQAYYAENEKWPPAGDVGKVLVPDFLRSAPTCPTSGKTYVIRPGNPPTVSCPSGVSDHTL